MADHVETLMEQAFRHERNGDRAQAIELYEEVAREYPDSEHAPYAQNCATQLRKYDEAAGPPDPIVEGVAWNSRGLLVTRDGTRLPEPCVISNLSEDLQSIRVKLQHVTIWIALAHLLLPLVVAILIPVETCEIHVPLSQAVRLRRWICRGIFWLCVPLSIAIVVAGFQFGHLIGGIAGIFLAMLVLIAARIMGSYFIELLSIRWIRGTYVGIAGANPEYVASLPVFPLKWNGAHWELPNDQQSPPAGS